MSKAEQERRNRYNRHLLNLERLEDRTVPATHVWQGPASGGLWDNAANWSNGVPTSNEAGGTIVQFNGGITSTMNIAGLEVDEINFTAGSNTILGTTTLAIDGSVLPTNVQGVGNNLFDFSLPINLVNVAIGVSSAAGGTLNFSGDISGSQGFAVLPSNAGDVKLGGTNTFTGQANVQGGRLLVTTDNALGTAGTGTVVTANGTLFFANVNSAEPITSQGGVITTNNGLSPALTGNITLASGTTNFNIPTGATMTLSGVISGANALRKTNTGTLVMSGTGSNTYTGATFVNDGTLQLSKGGGSTSITGNIGLTIGDGVGGSNSANVIETASNNIANASPVAVGPDGRFELDPTASDTISFLQVLSGGSVAAGGGGFGGLTLGVNGLLLSGTGSTNNTLTIQTLTASFAADFDGHNIAVFFSNHVVFDGFNGNDTLIGTNGIFTYDITSANAGSIASTNFTFTSVENLTGGPGTDTFNAAPSTASLMIIDGGGGTNSLVIDLAGTTNPFHTPTSATSGHTTYGNRQPLDYLNIQSFSSINGTFATNPPPSNVNLTAPSFVNENGQITLDGSFTNPDGETHSVAIDFGDGSAPVVLNLAAGASTFSTTHTYLDDAPSGNSSDVKTITATVSDGTGSAQGTRQITVNNVAPSNVNITTNPATIGVATTIQVTFTDPGTLDPHLIDIDFGDGSPVQSFGVAPGQGIFNKTHVYANVGTFTITATVHDDDLGTSPVVSTTVNVSAPDITPPTIFSTFISQIALSDSKVGANALLIRVTFDEAMNTSVIPILTFSPNVSSSLTLVSSQWINSTQHEFKYYLADANVSITTFMTVTGGADLGGNVMAPHNVGVGLTIDTQNPTVTNIDDGDADNLVTVNTPLTYTITFSEDIKDGTFTAADLDNTGTAAISVGTITEVNPGAFTVVITPTTTGTLQLRVPNGASVTDLRDNLLAVPVTDSDVLTVGLAEPVVTPAGNQSSSEGSGHLFNLGSFSDFNGSGNYTVTVNWGDGTPNTVFNQVAAGTITAQNHTYAQDGSFPVTVTVSDVDGPSTPVSFQANISNVLPVAVDAPAQNAVATIAKSFALGSFSDPGADAPWHITVNWGDSSPNGQFNVNQPGTLPPLTHTFANPGDFTVTVAVQDDDGSDSSTYRVHVVPPVVHLAGSIFRDFNGNGLHNANDVGQPGITVFVDQNNNGLFDGAEPSTITGANGAYLLDIGFEGPVQVRQVLPNGFRQTTVDANPVNAVFGSTVNIDELGLARNITPTLAVSSMSGKLSTVQVLNADGTKRFSKVPFGIPPQYVGEVRVATGDINDDGVEDVLVASGPGGIAFLQIWDGVDGHVLRNYTIVDARIKTGMFVASGDVNGDGFSDVIVGFDAGTSPLVAVINPVTNKELFRFNAYPSTFRGGVRVASGDVNGDGFADIITASGPGSGAGQVKVFSGGTGQLLQSFSPGAGTAGVFVAAGDLDGDGRAEIITGANSGAPVVKIFQSGVPTQSFKAFAGITSGGVRVAAKDLNGDGKADLLFATGNGLAPRVRGFDPAALLDLVTQSTFDYSNKNGVFVG